MVLLIHLELIVFNKYKCIVTQPTVSSLDKLDLTTVFNRQTLPFQKLCYICDYVDFDPLNELGNMDRSASGGFK